MVHDLVLATVFLSMIIAPALVAMRADGGEQDIEMSPRELTLIHSRRS